jgi:AcrR family transcriptional regulator
MKRISKKEIILDAALTLFNREGTSAMTTNHIARAAEVSPGNLYYHFRNKEEIIRELYERFCGEYATIWTTFLHGPFATKTVTDAVVAGFNMNAKYRFIALELGSLCHRDSVLMSRQREYGAVHFSLIRSAVDRMVAANVLATTSDETLYDDVLHMLWLINQYWLPYMYLLADFPDDADVRRGVRLALRVIEPYFTDAYRQQVMKVDTTLF